jgi:DNA-binding Lrp family transcriptional regulator
MAKGSKESMAKDEQKVLSILQSNGKDSIDSIAKKCRFSRQKVWRILKKAEKKKTIWGYSAIINEESLGLKHYSMLFKRTTQPASKKMIDEITFEKLDDIFTGLNFRIENIYYVHGSYDGIISFWADSLVTAKKFTNSFSMHMEGLVESIDLLETILSIRKRTIKNPDIKKLSEFL